MMADTRYMNLEFRDNEKILKDYFGDTTIDVQDLIDGFIQVVEENNDLKTQIEEDYEPKRIDPYEEYGISESDFH